MIKLKSYLYLIPLVAIFLINGQNLDTEWGKIYQMLDKAADALDIKPQDYKKRALNFKNDLMLIDIQLRNIQKQVFKISDDQFIQMRNNGAWYIKINEDKKTFNNRIIQALKESAIIQQLINRSLEFNKDAAVHWRIMQILLGGRLSG